MHYVSWASCGEAGARLNLNVNIQFDFPDEKPVMRWHV